MSSLLFRLSENTMTSIVPQPTIASQQLDEEDAWKKLIARDAGASFFYGVSTTGVFCRPGCASRRPLRTNVRFFATPYDAQAAGFRPCQRCKPNAIARSSPSEKLCQYIEEHLESRVSLEELGRVVGLSPFTVQRVFKREMGVTPLAYQRALRAGKLREALRKGTSVTDAIYAAGYSSSSRAYEGLSLGMTPSRFAKGGQGETIAWHVAETPFGWMIVGGAGRGLCWLALAATEREAEASLRNEFPAATLRRDSAMARWVKDALKAVASGSDSVQNQRGLQFDLRGTAFQLRVWQALRQIPRGQTRTYSQLARDMGIPNSTRAVARACAVNRVSVLVPCHRVVGASGSLTGYRWGVERKKKLLEAEKASC